MICSRGVEAEVAPSGERTAGPQSLMVAAKLRLTSVTVALVHSQYRLIEELTCKGQHRRVIRNSLYRNRSTCRSI